MKQATITINGRLYDALSGKPIQSAAKHVVQPKPVGDIAKVQPTRLNQSKQPAAAVHSKPQKPATLNRQALQKPAMQQTINKTAQIPSRSPLISRFKPAVINPIAAQQPQSQQAAKNQIANTTPLHPSIMTAVRNKASQASGPSNSKELKEMLIRERLAQVGHDTQAKKPNLFARKPRLASILVSSLSLLILAGYFTYINLTNISMRVAASNAGINATFPGYKPDGYNVNGPITYAPGEVAIGYKSNTSDSKFTLTQKSSNWDSQGVLDNFVRKQTSTYLTFQQRGVTVYTFNNKAAWTNGGLLYTIEGDASLSSDQILKLATSL